jgi:hypothetical protein
MGHHAQQPAQGRRTDAEQGRGVSPYDEKDRRRAALAVAALLLLQERRARRALRKALRVPLRLLDLGGHQVHVDFALREVGHREIVDLRTQARSASRKGWRKTTRQPVLQVIRGGIDEQRAVSAAAGLADIWSKQRAKLEQAGEVADPDTQALVDIEYAIERTAVTETVDAFNDEAEAMAGEAAARGLIVVQTWEGILDTRTCPECEALEGVTKARPDRFDELPPLHPGCRCFLSTWLTESTAAAAA